MPAAPLVSVVIPTYNHAHYLSEAIGSAASRQGLAPEIIVVDDGSSDDPAAVVSRHPGVRLIRQPNAGLAAARNTGWRQADSPHVVFLDADDRLLPGALASGETAPAAVRANAAGSPVGRLTRGGTDEATSARPGRSLLPTSRAVPARPAGNSRCSPPTTRTETMRPTTSLPYAVRPGRVEAV